MTRLVRLPTPGFELAGGLKTGRISIEVTHSLTSAASWALSGLERAFLFIGIRLIVRNPLSLKALDRREGVQGKAMSCTIMQIVGSHVSMMMPVQSEQFVMPCDHLCRALGVLGSSQLSRSQEDVFATVSVQICGWSSAMWQFPKRYITVRTAVTVQE